MTVEAPASAASAPTLSRYAVWKQIESAADRYASYGALALGVVALAALAIVL